MNDTELLQELTQIFHQVFGDDSILLTRKTNAKDIKEWDSMNHINIIIAIENRFGIKVPLAEMERFKNIGDAMDIIQKKLQAKSTAGQRTG